MVEHASDDVLGYIWAGPLENFVSDYEDDLGWLERQCSTNPDSGRRGCMLARGLGLAAELALIEMIRDRTLTVETLTTADWDRVSKLITQYADARLGVTDASLIALA